MFSLALLIVSAFLLTLVFTPVVRVASARLGWVDRPGPRKVHRIPVPRTGGIAIVAGYAVAFLILLYSPLGGSRSVAAALPGVWVLVPAVLAAFGTGLLDDIFGLKPWMKLVGQGIAALLAFQAHVQINAVAGHSFAATWWPLPLTVFWLVACSNAFNLIDGLDGLAVGVGLFATATTLMSALLNGNYALALATAPLLGALIGFLPYNFNPASIFMGDCGSIPLGFVLGCFGIIWSQKSATLLGMTAPLLALAIPLLDTSLSIARRFLRGQPIFGADRGHIHHRLLARGFTPRHVAYLFYGAAGIVAGFSLLLGSATNHVAGIVLIAFCAVVWLAVQYLGYEEFDAARRIIFGGMFRRTLNANLSIRKLERAVGAAHTLDECWDAVVETSRSLGFSEAGMQFDDLHRTARMADADLAACWELHIPLNHSGRMLLRHPLHSEQPPPTIVRFVTSVGTVFADKLATFAVSPAAPATGGSPNPAPQARAASLDGKYFRISIISEYQTNPARPSARRLGPPAPEPKEPSAPSLLPPEASARDPKEPRASISPAARGCGPGTEGTQRSFSPAVAPASLALQPQIRICQPETAKIVGIYRV